MLLIGVSNAGDRGLIPGSGRSTGEGKDNPLQYSCLLYPMNREAWQAIVPGVTKSWTRLSFHFHFLCLNCDEKSYFPSFQLLPFTVPALYLPLTQQTTGLALILPLPLETPPSDLSQYHQAFISLQTSWIIEISLLLKSLTKHQKYLMCNRPSVTETSCNLLHSIM